MCITTNQPDTKSKPNPKPTLKHHAIVNIQLKIVTCPTYPDKFIRDNDIAPFLQLSVVIVTLPKRGGGQSQPFTERKIDARAAADAGNVGGETRWLTDRCPITPTHTAAAVCVCVSHRPKDDSVRHDPTGEPSNEISVNGNENGAASGADWTAWLPGTCQMGRLVRRPSGPPRQILK